MVNNLKKLNPDVAIYSVTDPEFTPFGKVLNLDTNEIVAVGGSISKPPEGSSYVPSEPKFESLTIAKTIMSECFGEMPIQVGYCWGESHKLNAFEWHTSSEVNIAITDLMLLLAPESKIVNGKISTDNAVGFFVPKGTAIEVYATSLHFCPISVSDCGFGCVVALPKGTNTDLETPHSDKMLFRKNKWIICCEDNSALIARGVVPGVIGENYEIKY